MSSKAGKFLANYVDEGLEIDSGWSVENEMTDQRQRLSRLMAMAAIAGEIPRRLGADASPPELRADKRLNNSLKNRFSTICQSWTTLQGEEAPLVVPPFDDEEVRKQAAQIDWDAWWPEHKVWLSNHGRVIANHALKLKGRSWANKLVYRLEFEYNMLRDLLEPVS